jgi:threonine synthase
VPADSLVVCTVTGHGLKDPDTALRATRGDGVPSAEPVVVAADPNAVAAALGLA